MEMGTIDMELTQWLVQLGTGGALAAMLFWFYRQDSRRATEQWKNQSDHLLQVVVANTEAATTHAEVLRAHTAAVTTNTEVLRALHGELMMQRRESRREGHA